MKLGFLFRFERAVENIRSLAVDRSLLYLSESGFVYDGLRARLLSSCEIVVTRKLVFEFAKVMLFSDNDLSDDGVSDSLEEASAGEAVEVAARSGEAVLETNAETEAGPSVA